MMLQNEKTKRSQKITEQLDKAGAWNKERFNSFFIYT